MRDCVNGAHRREGVSDPGRCAPDFLTMEEAAQILRVGRNQVYELARVWRATGGERGVPVVEFGRRAAGAQGRPAAPGRPGRAARG